MGQRRFRLTLAVLFGLLSFAICPPVAIGEDISAAARLEAMAKFLSQAQRLGVVADCAYDVLQETGEKIEFGERRELTLQRPNRGRVEVTQRDGARRGLVFDGTQLVAFDRDEKVYATIARPGTLDAALDYYAEELKMRLPLRELFAADLPQQLESALANVRWIAKETVGDVVTDHVAYRGDNVDVQLWIARDGDPLPARIVISYRLASGQPQFAANFRSWTLNPDVSDTQFTFVPAADAEKIPFAMGGRKALEKKP